MKIFLEEIGDRETREEILGHSKIIFGEGREQIRIYIRDGQVYVNAERSVVIVPVASNSIVIETSE